MSTIELGAKVPAFTAESTQGTINSQDLISQPFVLYFYPRDNTPGCTNQANDFQAKLAEFDKLGVKIIGASRDSMSSHERFAERLDLDCALLSHPEETGCNLGDVIKDKNRYGRKGRGIERSTLVFNAHGELVQEGRRVRAPGHIHAVLGACQN